MTNFGVMNCRSHKAGFLLLLLLWMPSCAHQDESSANRLLLQANMAAFDRQYEEALDLLQAATKNDPEFAPAWLSKGMVYRRLQNDPLAAKCYEVAQLLYRKKHMASPDNIDYIKGYAEALSLMGRKEESMKILDEAIARFPRERALLSFKEAIKRPHPLGFDQPAGTGQ
jgi:tetratricopeptide (TPR) repeat protein